MTCPWKLRLRDMFTFVHISKNIMSAHITTIVTIVTFYWVPAYLPCASTVLWSRCIIACKWSYEANITAHIINTRKPRHTEIKGLFNGLSPTARLDTPEPSASKLYYFLCHLHQEVPFFLLSDQHWGPSPRCAFNSSSNFMFLGSGNPFFFATLAPTTASDIKY